MSTTGENGGGAAGLTAREAAVQLQDRLHQLLQRLSDAVDLIKDWPEAKGDDTSIHVESTGKLIGILRSIVASINRVESVAQTNPNLRKKLQDCAIPLDLLDLLDHGQGGGALNPDCFVRGLLKEALGQLAGLKRRKLALELLGSAVKSGLNKKRRENLEAYEAGLEKKRDRDESDKTESPTNTSMSPPTKRAKI